MTFDRELASDLDAAVISHELFAVFQPQIDLESGEIVAVEALCRWRHPVRGIVPPDVFIPLSEATGAIHAIGSLMLDAGLELMARWSQRRPAVTVSVNVSPLQLDEIAFFTAVRERLAQRQLRPERLTIEITEARPIAEGEAVADRLQDLRMLGVGVALDDFGTGHASTAQLERLPVSEVKIDRSLIQSSATNRNLTGMIERARDRGLCVVAEGVETEAHLGTAKRLHCHRAQGYLIGMPMREAQIQELVA